MLRKSSICILFVFLLLLSSAYALTAKLGSPRVVLYPEVTPSNPAIISRTLEVINSNDIPVHITLNVSDNCTDIIKVGSSESDFTLQANQSKAVPYIVKVTQPGFYECKINTYFTEEKEGKKGPGVALAAVVIISARGEGSDLPPTNNTVSNDTSPITPNDNDTSDGVSISTGGNNPPAQVNKASSNYNAFAISFFILILVVIALLVFFVIRTRRDGNAKV